MKLADPFLEDLAQALDRAAREGIAIAQPTGEQQLSLAQGHRVQARLTDLRCARGETITGLKLAFTNRKTMARVGVSAPVSASLCSGMQIPAGGSVAMAGHLRLRAEPEVAFLLHRALPADATLAQARAAIAGVAVAIEIVDSRYRDFQFNLPDMVADSASACAYVLGNWQVLTEQLDLGALAVTLECDGTVVASGSTSAILDHPLHALVEAARLAVVQGQPLGAGSVVLAGSATDPFVLAAGQRITARMDTLGVVDFQVTER
jgi:2-oxo-3-hexenedioate decarboxylase